MVLFYCGHEGTVSQIISLKCHRYAQEEAVLSMPRIDFQQSNFAKGLVEEKIFNKIILVEIAFSLKEESVEKQEQKIIDYFDTVVEQNDIDFNSFSNIYIIQDVNGEFPVYLSMKNISYILIETYAGNYRQFDDLKRYSASELILKASNSYTAVLEKHKALCGSGDVCKKRLRSENGTSDHSKSLLKDEWVDFNFLFNNIPDEYKNSIYKCLDKNIDSIQEKDSCLVLSNSSTILTTKTRLDIAHVHLVYQLALDYYNHNDEARISVKEHPYRAVDFSLDKYIENPIVFDSIIPFEFYRFIPNFSINKVLSVCTSAIDKIADYVKENVRLGESYFHYFRLCHKLFFAFSLYLKLNSGGGGGKTVCNYAKGLNAEFIHNFAHFCFNDFPKYEPKMGFGWQNLKGDNFIIMDEVPPGNKKELIAGLDGTDPLTKIVFLNTKKDFAFFDFERLDLLEYIIPFVIKKSSVSNKCISDTEDETLFFFCKDKAVRNAAKTFSMQKSLKHTKLIVHISAVSWEKIFKKLLSA
ncbi:MAG: hypothetical protein LBK25_03580 [Treponema sp.]|jgi:hypothetical protein|nr:hypothetical protein [Treponema sp.]